MAGVTSATDPAPVPGPPTMGGPPTDLPTAGGLPTDLPSAGGPPTDLRAEHLDEPLGLDEPRPRLSWRLPAGTTRQVAYELVRDDGAGTRRIDSTDNVLRAWPGPDLGSRERRELRVRVWTDRGESPWSQPLVVEAGLTDPADWRAAWVSPHEPVVAPAGQRPAYLLRGQAEVTKPVTRARLYATAHGIYEPHLNGRRVGNLELAPGYTEYGHRVQVQTYDVTDLVQPGTNVLGAVLADGWYRGQVGLLRAHDQWGARTSLLAQLVVDHPDGSTTVLVSGPDWLAQPSSIVAADLIEGVRQDLRLLDSTWCTTTTSGTWTPVDVPEVDQPYAALVGPVGPPVRAVEAITPRSVTRVATDAGDVDIVDLGQNINGHVRLTGLRRLAPAGTELTLTHGEALGPDGDVTMTHLQPNMPFLPAPLSAGQVDAVVVGAPLTSGDAAYEPSGVAAYDVFEPTLTTHGFQYARIAGTTEPVQRGDVAGVVVHSDLRPTGTFDCSDADLNALHSAAVWSLRDNICDIPTDCPTRERAGWTGDWQLYAPTASFLYDVAGFSLKWLRDIAVERWSNGVIGNMAPIPPAERTGFLATVNGSAGWGDAIVLVPWELWREYGDRDLLAELWPAMLDWLRYAEDSAASGRHPARVASRPDPAPHERYLWDTGFHWGEWLVPGDDVHDFEAFKARDKADVATAYLAWSAAVAAQIGDLLGRVDDAARLRDLAANARAAWVAEFVGADGTLTPDTQANHVRALAFDLVPPSMRQGVADRLARLVRENGNRLGTGFLATPDLLPVLADHGHLDAAYDLLFQREQPSWLAMIDRGATTMWELWEGIDADGVPHESLNHYSKGAVISFFHRYVAGLRRTSPTWRTFEVAPMPGGGLTWAHARHTTPHGEAASAWRVEDDRFMLEVTVPPGCSATVRMPSGAVHADLTSGRHEFSE